jgi:hypothetical protein
MELNFIGLLHADGYILGGAAQFFRGILNNPTFSGDPKYIEMYYNQRRKHSATGWRTPAHCEQAWYKLRKVA